jgi:hypothetical protein
VLPEPEALPPVFALDDEQCAAELGRLQRNRARDAAREADVILRLAELRPDTDDPKPGTPGARSRTWRKTEPEFPGVSEFLPDEVAHAMNVGRGTAAFRTRRAFTWEHDLPATFRALRRGEIDERRAGVLADALQHTTSELARQVEATLLPEAGDLSPTALKNRALSLLAELDADAVQQRHVAARKAADVRSYDTGDGMAAVTVDMPAEQAAACTALIGTIAAMAKADGDERPIGQIRAEIATMLLMRPADSDQGGVTVHLTVTATLDGLEGRSTAGGEVNGSAITATQLRDQLNRVGALGLTAPDEGTLNVAVTDENGRLLATLTDSELERLAKRGCPDHRDDAPEAGCVCRVAGMPPDTDAYRPTAAQERFIDARDRRCRQPNCGQRAGWADHDHVIPHGEGGTTACTNLCCLCRTHHRLKTFAPGWRFRMDPDGTLYVTSPSGITRTTRPPGLRPPGLRQPAHRPEPPTDPTVDDPPPY